MDAVEVEKILASGPRPFTIQNYNLSAGQFYDVPGQKLRITMNAWVLGARREYAEGGDAITVNLVGPKRQQKVVGLVLEHMYRRTGPDLESGLPTYEAVAAELKRKMPPLHDHIAGGMLFSAEAATGAPIMMNSLDFSRCQTDSDFRQHCGRVVKVYFALTAKQKRVMSYRIFLSNGSQTLDKMSVSFIRRDANSQ